MPAPDGGDDFIGVGGPDEGPGIFILLGEEAIDRSLQVDERVEDAALEAPLEEFRKEALDGIEPGA